MIAKGEAMRIKFTGTGDGMGIPAVGCKCKLCTLAREEGGKNHRRRVSILLRNGTETVLYDAPPTIGEMINRERIFDITAIFLSHKHFDHIGGITEFEYWPKKISVYGNMSVLGNFEITDRLYEQCKFYVLHDRETLKVGQIKITPFEVSHKIPTFGLLFNQNERRIVHFNDKMGLKLEEFERRILKKSNIAIFHTPGFEGGTDHIDVVNVMKIAQKHPTIRFVITHIGHNNFSHEELVEKAKPYKNMIVAYDGLELTA